MPVDAEPAPLRRSVVPPRAGRSIWLAAAWTGAGTAIVCAIVAIVAVAICWLPASGSSGNAPSTLRAGLLTFLAALHGGITVDSVAADFVPLGLTILLALLAWRAGAGLADAAADLDEQDRGRLAAAAVFQAGVFAAVCAVAGRVATLGTSSVPAVGVILAAFALFLVAGGGSFVRHSPLGADLTSALPPWAGRAGRAAAAVVAVYLTGGALLTAASLAMHHQRVQALAGQVGGGWSGVPILLLGALAAPNAVIAAASYLAGPGFAVGTGNGVDLATGGHGVVPAFPILGGVPSHPAGPWAWTLAACTLVAAVGCATALVLHRPEGAPVWRGRFADLLRAAPMVALAGAVLAWQGGGGIGSGRLAAIGASPWRLGLALGAITAVGGSLALVALAAGTAARARFGEHEGLHTIVERAAATAELASVKLDSARNVVPLEDEEGGQQRGFLRSTWTSVTHAVTTTEDERAAG